MKKFVAQFVNSLNILMVLSVLNFSACNRKEFEKKQVNAEEKKNTLSQKNSNGDQEKIVSEKEKLKSGLDELESGIELSAQNSKASGEFDTSKLIEFRISAMNGCDSNLNGCKNIDALKQKPNASTILILGLSSEKDIHTIDLVIRFASEVKTRAADERFQNLFINCLLKNLKGLIELNSSLYHKILLANIDSLKSIKDADLLRYFEEFNLFNFADSEISKTIKIKLLGYLLSKPSLSEHFSSLIKASNSESEIYKYVKDRQENDPKFLEFSKVKPLGFSALEFVLIGHSSGHFNSAESRGLAAKLSDKSPGQIEIINNFVRAKTIYTSHLANLNLKKELPNFLKFTDVNVFLDLCSTITVKNRSLWRAYSSSLENAELISKVFAPENNDLRELIGNSKKNIQYMSSHPHLALISYFIAKNKMVMEFKFYGVYKIHYKTVISMFLNGGLNGLLGYFENTGSLNVNDVVVSMYYAFRSGLFTELGLNAYDFINEFTKTLLADEIYRFKIDTQKWKLLSNDSGFLNKVADINKSFETNSFEDIRTSWTNFSLDPIYGDYLQQLYGQAPLCSFLAGSQDCQMTTSSSEGHNIFWNSPLTFRTEVLKNYVSGRRSIIAAMVGALESAEIENGRSKEDVAKKLAESTPLFEEFNRTYQEFVKVAVNYSNKYYKIVTDMINNSRKAKIQIFMSEVEHLKKVHALMSQVRNNKEAISDANKYLASVNTHAELQKYKTDEKISSEVYTANLLDHIFRMISQASQFIGKDKSKYAIVSLTDHRIFTMQNKSHTDKKMMLSIPYKENLQDFLIGGMSQLVQFANGEGGDSNSWFGIGSTANLVYQWSFFGGYDAQYFTGIGTIYFLSEMFGLDFTANKLVEQSKEAYEILNARESEIDFYNYTNLKGYFEEKYPEHTEQSTFPTYDIKAGAPRPIMDYIFLSVAQPSVNMGTRNENGSANGADVSAGWSLPDFKIDLINLYMSNKFRGSIFFEVPNELNEKIEKNYVSLLAATDRAVKNLKKELQSRKGELGLYRIDYRNGIQVPLFDMKHLEDYDRHIEDFNNRTDGHFKKFLDKD
jgi:hypothetical protein